MKRFVLMGKIASISVCAAAMLAASCNWLPENQKNTEDDAPEATLVLNFANTKASGLDTDEFHLTVVRTENESHEPVADTFYSGKFGVRPEEMKVKAGRYLISVLSDTTAMPAMETPVYGDRVSVTASGGGKSEVTLMCKMTNSGVKFTFSPEFAERYRSETPVIITPYGRLSYPLSRSGKDIAYFESGTIYFTAGGSYLFSKELIAGEIRHLKIDASSDRSGVGFTISLDESVSEVEDIQKVDGIPVLNVAGAKEMPRGLSVTVRGKVVGVVSNGKIVAEAAVSSNIVLADYNGEYTLANVLPVELKNSQQKKDLAFDSVVGKYVTVTGTLEKRYDTTSLLNVTSYAVQ